MGLGVAAVRGVPGEAQTCLLLAVPAGSSLMRFSFGLIIHSS